MQDYPDTIEKARIRPVGNDDVIDKSRSREGDLASDKLGLPLLSDDPAPLSDALHIPTLISDTPETEKPGEKAAPSAPRAAPRPVVAGIDDGTDRSPHPGVETSWLRPLAMVHDDNANFDRFGRSRSSRLDAAPHHTNSNRATTPAGEPRADAATWIGVPSNHPQTAHSGQLAKLDKVAIVLGAVITIGPLFAAMIGRMAV
jgi:hypothetical protein